jgi:hypothetical protein
MSDQRIAELKAELETLEAEKLATFLAYLWTKVAGLNRAEMIVLRDMMNENIKATYDGDDE